MAELVDQGVFHEIVVREKSHNLPLVLLHENFVVMEESCLATKYTSF
jgi:hypothetical protein